MKNSFRLGICLLSLLAVCQSLSAQTLEEEFLNPPMSSRTYVWWHWMGPNFSKEGIRKDLQAMKDCGIGGATIFNLTSMVRWSCYPTENVPWPDQTYRSDAYWDALRYACKVADSLGIELGLHNAPGYSTTGGPWIDESRNMKKIVYSKVGVDGGGVIEEKLPVPEIPPYKGWGAVDTNYVPEFHDMAVIALSADKGMGVRQVDLTKLMSHDGSIEWNAPSGKWMIYRMGYCATMSTPHPVPDDIMGKTREVDKMNREDNVFHWDNVLKPLKEHLGSYLGSTLRYVLIDSYEAGGQDWSTNFKDDFMKMYGYDPTPYLPYLFDHSADMVVDSVMLKRFTWDYNQMRNYLYQENGWNVGRSKVHAYGLKLQQEPYWGPFSTTAGAANVDLPMGEFWAGGDGSIPIDVPAGARAANRTLIGAEAYSSQPDVSRWTEDPAMLKKATEGAFIAGVNQMFLHQWVLEPFDDKYQPGMTMGWWGTHFSRFQPWFRQGFAFYNYLDRCQFMLQSGEQVIDHLALDKVKDKETDAITSFDFLNDDIRVSNGRIVLPSGRTYVDLEIDAPEGIQPEVLSKVGVLLSRGAVVVMSKPKNSCSLQNYPECDAEVSEMADELWKEYSGKQIFESRDDAMKAIGFQPDYFALEGDPKVVHRHCDEGEIYLITNMSSKPQKVSVSLRSSGLLPEVWNAVDRTMGPAQSWHFDGTRTVVSLQLDQYSSRFVVLRRAATDEEVRLGRKPVPEYVTASSMDLSKDWNVHFEPKLSKAFDKRFSKLTDFSKSRAADIKYFSGTATYSKTFSLSSSDIASASQIWLDLGEMNDIASLVVNGHEADTLWFEPYRAEIGRYLHEGENTVEIEVSVNWPNMLIGDERFPADYELAEVDKENALRGANIRKYPDWFLRGEQRPSKHRKTFSTWNYYSVKSTRQLQPAGLAGPVKLEFLTEKN